VGGQRLELRGFSEFGFGFSGVVKFREHGGMRSQISSQDAPVILDDARRVLRRRLDGFPFVILGGRQIGICGGEIAENGFQGSPGRISRVAARVVVVTRFYNFDGFVRVGESLLVIAGVGERGCSVDICGTSFYEPLVGVELSSKIR
jgi:hypothetical protein